MPREYLFYRRPAGAHVPKYGSAQLHRAVIGGLQGRVQRFGKAAIAVQRFEPGGGGAALARHRIAQFFERGAGIGERHRDGSLHRAEHERPRLIGSEAEFFSGSDIGARDLEDITRSRPRNCRGAVQHILVLDRYRGAGALHHLHRVRCLRIGYVRSREDAAGSLAHGSGKVRHDSDDRRTAHRRLQARRAGPGGDRKHIAVIGEVGGVGGKHIVDHLRLDRDDDRVEAVVGDGRAILDEDYTDLLEVVVRRSGTDYELDRMSRGDYLTTPTKTTQGRPSQYYYNRQVTPQVTLWPTPDSSNDTLVYYYVQRMDDADTLVNTTDAPFRFYPCMAAGLAYYIAIKKAPERVQLLKSVYEEEFQRAADEDEDRVPLKIQPSIQYLRVN